MTGLTQHKDDSWTVHTSQRRHCRAEIVVNACGYRVNEVARDDGRAPSRYASMEHQYFLTEDIQAIIDAGHRMPLLRCPISDYYCRQEKNGLLVGFYEQELQDLGHGRDQTRILSNDLCPDRHWTG